VIEILDMLRSLVRDRGLAVLLSSHLLAQVQSVCDRVGIFAAGKLIGLGTVPELAEQFGEDTTHIEVGFDDVAGEDRKAIAERLGKIEAVERVQAPARADEPFVLVTRPIAARGVREATLKVAAASGLGLSSIREVVPSLDDIYRRAVKQAGLDLRRVAA
jgi:ABC-2 type transport system ATP-binding protein